MSFPPGSPHEQQVGATATAVGATSSAATTASSHEQIHNHPQIHPSNDPSGSSDNSSSSQSTTVSPGSAETTASSAAGTSSNWKPEPNSASKHTQHTQQHHHPYRNILTHQERKKLRMPKRKADSWPASILSDPDVLSLDDEGRFVLCKVCHVHYAVHGGKKPKPVIMNSSFRTRAWDVHKERTNSHRIQKKQDDHRHQPLSSHVGTTALLAAADEDEQKAPAGESKNHTTENSNSNSNNSKPSLQQHKQQQQQQQQQQHQQSAQAQTQQSVADEQQQVRFAPPAPRTQQGRSPLGRPEFISPPPPSPRRRVFRTSAQMSSHQWQPSDHEVHRRSSSHASPHDHHLNADPSAMSVIVVGAIGAASSSAIPAASVAASSSAHGRKAMTNASMASEQRDGMMRWRNMHDDVSRALSSMPKRSAADQYPSAEMRSSNAALGETEDFGMNNEKVAKKLKSLDDEYDAKTLKRPDVHYDRRSANYKQYWGTLRDVYTAPTNNNSSSSNNNNNNNNSTHNHSNNNNNNLSSNHKTLPSLRQRNTSNNNSSNNYSSSHHKDASHDVGDSTTPDDTGSSEDSAKTIVVHDQTLVNAIDRLTSIVSKQLSSERHAQESSATVAALSSLTSAVTELRVHQDNHFGRLIELQEQRLQVMEAILQHKLRKEARSSATNGSNGNGGSNNSNSGLNSNAS